MSGFVYKWVNKINQKWYIGSHKGTLDDGYVASGRIIKLAIKKYGIESFEREILYEGSNFREIEQTYLVHLDAENNSQSYNLKNNAAGGNGGANKGRTQTVETKKKISEANTGRLSGDINPSKRPEVREKISEANTGKTLTKETKDKISKANKGRHSNKTHKEIYGEEEAKKRKERMSGNNNPSKRPEVRARLSAINLSKETIYCPHCEVSSINLGVMNRWHFENCKKKPH